MAPFGERVARSGPMVAQQTATATRKPTTGAYKPHVRLLDAERGLYTVQSERYTHLLYAVDVAQGTCACESGQRQFKGVKRLGGVCKHLCIARQYHTHRMTYLAATTGRPATGEVAAGAPESGLGVRVASSGEGYEVYSLRTGALICHVDDPARAGLPTTPTQGVDWKTLAAEFAALPVPAFNFRAQAALVPAFIPAPTAFAELFAA